MSTTRADLSSHYPAEILEQRAGEQRQRIHNSVGELKSSLRETVREHLDVESHARAHIWRFIAGTSMIALISGYNIAGIFTRR